MKQGWEIKNLGELVNIKTGKLDSNAMVDDGKYPFFTCSREIFAINDYAFDCEAILLAGNNASGDFNVKHYKGKFNAYQRTYVITVNAENKILYGYLYQQLTNHLKRFKEQSLGANTKFLKIGMIQGMEIPLPPLPEQQRIVAILDEVFAAIAKARANAEQNLKNAKELFESYLQRVFENKGEGWEEKKLGEVTNVQRGSSPRPKGDPKYFSMTETEYNWITISDISSYTENNVLLQTREWLTELGSKQSRYVDKNEFIIAVSGSTTGKCCITGIKGFIYDGLAVVKILNKTIEPKFLLNYMLSLYTTINNSKSGAAFPNINTNYLNNLPFPFPPLKEQKIIVQKLDVLSTETKKLEAIYQSKINDLEELKKSVLQKAFAGQLIMDN